MSAAIGWLRRHGFALFWSLAGLFLVLRTGGRDRGVIYDHLEFGRRLFAGADLYAPYLEDKPLHPVYPPSFGLMTWPFTVFGEVGARYAWGLVQVLALFWIGRFLLDGLRRARPGLAPRAQWILLATALVMLRYVLRDTHGGGGNLINVALALAAFRLAEDRRVLAGALVLGFSLATKPTTVLLVPVFFLLGHRRVAVGSLAATFGFVGLALAVNRHGLDPLARWFEGSLAYGAQADLFADPHLGFPPFTWMNQSLRCAVARYFGHVPEPWVSEVPGFFQGAGLAPGVTVWITRALSFAVLALTLREAWRRRGSAPDRRVGLAVALVASLLLSPISWKAHHVALIPAMFAVVVAAFGGSRVALGLAAGYWFVCGAGGGDLVGDAVKEWQQSLYLATLGNGIVLAWLLRRPHHSAPP